MLRFLLRQAVRRFEARWRYDASYMHQILGASVPAMLRFMAALPLQLQSAGVAPAAWHAARIAAARHQDCGPCTQLVLDMAAADGVPAAELRAIVRRDASALSADAALGLRLADACLQGGAACLPGAEADRARDEVRARYGEEGLVALACAVAMTPVYPMFKRVLGHTHSCVRLQVAGESLAAARAPALASAPASIPPSAPASTWQPADG